MKRLILSLFLTICAFTPAATFQGLGANTVANDISADGSVVVGSGRWTQSAGWQDIGGTATACSADGSVVVGYQQKFDYWGGGYTTLTYWTAENGLSELTNSSIECAYATDVSDDGRKIVGYITHGGSDNYSNPFYKEAFLYEVGQGRILLGDLIDQDSGDLSIISVAYAISGDGLVVVGSGTLDSSIISRGMYWMQSTGMQNIGLPSPPVSDLDYMNESCVTSISRDGSKMIGQSGINSLHATVWTEQMEMQTLEPLGRYSSSCALSISDDLSTIIGWAYADNEYTAFLWNESQGMMNFQELLQNSYELNLDGWTLTEATGISADGLTIVGNGINPDGFEEAWIVTVPEPASMMLLTFGLCCVRCMNKGTRN